VELLNPWESFPAAVKVGTPSGVLIRRAALADVGGWNTHVPGAGDYHMWLRLSVRAPLVMTRARTVGYRIHPHSQSMALRSSRVPEYMRIRERAAAGALVARLAARPEDGPYLSRRFEVAGLMPRLAEAVLGRRPAALRKAASDLEDVLRPEPLRFIHHVFLDWLWFFTPEMRCDGRMKRANALFTTCSRHWPAGARRTRLVLRALVVATALGRVRAAWSDL
jgi:hypothetical protein